MTGAQEWGAVKKGKQRTGTGIQRTFLHISSARSLKHKNGLDCYAAVRD
jgi:hypothetical protein